MRPIIGWQRPRCKAQTKEISMAKALKIIVAVVLALIALLALALFVITRVIDPNDFKPEISAAAQENANLDLAIEGDLSWTFWPSLGVKIGHTEARIHEQSELFAGLDEIHVGVAVWPLIYGRVEMDAISVHGLQLNLVEGPDGANWEQIGSNDDALASTPSDEEDAADESASAMDIPLSIPSVSIHGANIRYRMLADGTDITVENANISAQNVALDKPFTLQASLRYQDQSDIRIDTDLDTTLAMDLEKNIFQLDALAINANIGGVTTLPIAVTAKMDVDAALDEDRVSIRNLSVDAAGTHTTGGMDINQLSGAMVFAGELHVAPFDANAALKAIGEEAIETSDENALKNVSLDAVIGGPENSIMANPLTIKLDSSNITGSAGLANLDSGKIVFDLSLDKLVADGYLPSDADDSSSDTDGNDKTLASNTSEPILPPLSDAEFIPLEDLRSLIVDGKFNVGSFSYMDINASNMNFVVSAQDGLMKLSKAQGEALGGKFNATATLDARTGTPTFALTKHVETMQLQPVVEMALEDDLFTGILDMDITLNSHGNSEKALVANAVGKTTFHLADGTVRGANLYNSLLGGINELLGSYQQLSVFIPGQESGKLPMELSQDTRIIDLDGVARIEKETAYIDRLNANLDRGKIDGKGVLNLRSEAFDIKIGMKSPDITDNKYLKDQTWPLRCKGNLQGDAAGWCRNDKDGFKAIGKSVAAQMAKDKIKDKFGIDGEGDPTDEIVTDAAKKTAQDELQKKLDEKLKGLFK
jgi:AsmA protein